MGEVVILPVVRRESEGLAAQDAGRRDPPRRRTDAEVAAERARRKAAKQAGE
jgi:hypothetical protein